MRRSERLDLKGWIALAWALVFAVLYARMIVERKVARRPVPPPARIAARTLNR